MFLSTKALRHLTPSPSPIDIVEETEEAAPKYEPEEEKSFHNVFIFIAPDKSFS